MLYWLNLWNKRVTRSYDDVDIDITNLRVQSSLKFLLREISESKDLLTLLLYHADHTPQLLYLKSNKK